MTRPTLTVALLAACIRLALVAEAAQAAPTGNEATAGAAGNAQQTAALAWLSGQVTDADGAPVFMAEITLAGTDAFAYTGEDGRYVVQHVPGTVNVVVSNAAAGSRTIEAVELVANTNTPLDVQLQTAPGGSGDDDIALADGEEAQQLETIEVEQQIIREGTAASVIMDRRYSPQVVDAISAEQISRAGDSDAGSALKRVTGLTLVGGKHVYVRGLGERYSSVLLSGAQMPSPDPTRRVVPLDLFPTDVLGSINVQKTYSADMPGEFAGGSVQLQSKRVVDDFQMRVSVSGKYLHGTTGEDGLRYDGGGRDWLGDGVGARAFPDGMSPYPTDPAAREAISEAVAARGYRTHRSSIDPGVGLGFGIGDSFDIGEWSFGYLGSLRYAHDWASRSELRRAYSLSGGNLETRSDYVRERTERTVDTSALVTLGAERGSDHGIGLTLMHINQASDDTRIDEGWDTQANEVERKYQLEWVENTLDVAQLHGHHVFPALSYLELDWLYSKAEASRDEPNTRSYEYRRVDDGSFRFLGGSNNNGQQFAELEDENDEYRLDLSLPVQFTDNLAAIFQVGAGRLERDRSSFIRKFQFRGAYSYGDGLLDIWDVLVPENIAPGRLLLQEVTQATDAYVANQTLDSRYLAVELGWADRFRLNLGVREEDNLQRVETYQLFSPNPTPVVGEIDQVDRLPSAAFTWMYSENAQLRLGYSETLSRPDFRELTRAQFIDPELDIATRGNPNLVQTDIRNLDLRWEYYFSDTELFSAALFKKDFDNPIERVNQAGTGALLELRNAASAENYGIELDYFAGLGVLRRWSWIDNGWLGRLPLDNLYVGLNYARIESEVDLGDSTGIQTSAQRPLQGQSPYVANVQLGYRSEDGRLETTLLYNVFGERISQAGVQGIPDVYEQPFHQLDLVFSWAFAERWKMKAQGRNLLNPEVEYTQGDLPTLAYRRGREFGVSLEWAW